MDTSRKFRHSLRYSLTYSLMRRHFLHLVVLTCFVSIVRFVIILRLHRQTPFKVPHRHIYNNDSHIIGRQILGKKDAFASRRQPQIRTKPSVLKSSNLSKSRKFIKSKTRNKKLNTSKRILVKKAKESQKRVTACPDMTIQPQKGNGKKFDDVACRPYVLPEEICKFTAEYFAVDAKISKCQDQKEPPYDLCKVSETKTNGPLTRLSISCDLSPCNRAKDVYVEVLDPDQGKLKKHKIPKDATNTDVENLVHQFAEKTRTNGFPFLFLNCTGRDKSKNVVQILTLLPSLPAPEKESSAGKMNVNVVLLDSISRPHFYRSFPKTVSYLRKSNGDPSYSAHLFDFELFQAVHGHTNENERALFNGSLFPGDLSEEERQKAPVNLDVLFGVFKRAGFQTMFLDDLCWESAYGLADKFKVRKWKDLQRKLKTSNIDTTGITDASCAMLKHNKLSTPFFDTAEHQICFNGKHQHWYLLDYLTRYLEAARDTRSSKPLFSYTCTHVSHESRGLRVQSLDADLKEFVSSMSTKRNTITIILADHGNTYTSYQSTIEGRQEMYHPMMLVVLPKELGTTLGHQVVSNLRTNQHRLFNLFDVRAGLLELARYDGVSGINPVGIFGAYSKNRTCDDLAISSSSMCVCQGWETSVANSTDQLAIAEFAVGTLNNKIQESLVRSQKRNNIAHDPSRLLFGACQRLRIQSVENIRTRKTREGIHTTTMDVQVQSGNIIDQRELVTVRVSFHKKTEGTFDMRLLSFDRVSTYGSYKQCADSGVDLKLCVCNKPGRTSPKHSIYDIVGKNSKVTQLQNCLYEIRRGYISGRNAGYEVQVFEIANVCDGFRFTATFNAETENVRLSTRLPVVVNLSSRTTYFVAASRTQGNVHNAKLTGRWSIKTNKIVGSQTW